MARYAVDGAGVPLPWRGCGEDGGCGVAAWMVRLQIQSGGGADAEVGLDGVAAAAGRTGRVAAHEKGPGSTGCPKNESKDCMLF